MWGYGERGGGRAESSTMIHFELVQIFMIVDDRLTTCMYDSHG